MGLDANGIQKEKYICEYGKNSDEWIDFLTINLLAKYLLIGVDYYWRYH